MRISSFALCLAPFLATITNAYGQDTPTHWNVFVVAGQSPVVGPEGLTYNVTPNVDDQILYYRYPDWEQVPPWDEASTVEYKFTNDSTQAGPEVAFGRWLVHSGWENVVMIKVAQGGHGVESFLRPERRLNFAAGQTNMWERMNRIVDQAMILLRLRGNQATLRGFCYFQGWENIKTDIQTINYGAHLGFLIEDVRALVDNGSAPNMPFIVTVSPNWPDLPLDKEARLAIVQEHQRQVPLGVTHCASVESNNPLGVPNVILDDVHPDPASTERIGRVMAEAFLINFNNQITTNYNITADAEEEYLELSLIRPSWWEESSFTVQTTNDLTDWPSDSSGVTSLNNATNNGNGTLTETYRRYVPIRDTPKAFMRVVLSDP